MEVMRGEGGKGGGANHQVRPRRGGGAGQTVLRAHAIAAAEQKSLKRAGRRSGGRGRSRLSQQGAGIRGVFSPLVLHVHCP